MNFYKALFTVAGLSLSLQAAATYTADFSGMSASNVSSVAAEPGANDFAWSAVDDGHTPNATTFSVNDGAITIHLNDSKGGALAIFPELLSLQGNDYAPGSSITLSFTGQFSGSIDSVDAFRFGFVQTDDLRLAAGATIATGTNTVMRLRRGAVNSENGPLSGTGDANIRNGGALASGLGTASFNASFTLTKSETVNDNFEYSVTVNGSTFASDGVKLYWGPTDAIFFRMGGGTDVSGIDLTLSNIQVEIIPEPSIALLGGLGLLGILRRRRR